VILARSLAAQAPDSKPDLNRQIAELTALVQKLQSRVDLLEEKLAANLVLRQEWRTDFSNQAYFLTDVLGSLKRQQSTATMGVVWWFGSKKSPW
jgi:hypothetical protein